VRSGKTGVFDEFNMIPAPLTNKAVTDSFNGGWREKFILGKFLFPGLKAGANDLLFNGLK
jgi:hypothetical protein